MAINSTGLSPISLTLASPTNTLSIAIPNITNLTNINIPPVQIPALNINIPPVSQIFQVSVQSVEPYIAPSGLTIM